jgi:hypothetical protein
MKIVALVSCMGKRIVPLIVFFPSQLFHSWDYMTFLQPDYIVLQQHVKKFIALCYMKYKMHFIPFSQPWLQKRTSGGTWLAAGVDGGEAGQWHPESGEEGRRHPESGEVGGRRPESGEKSSWRPESGERRAGDGRCGGVQ